MSEETVLSTRISPAHEGHGLLSYLSHRFKYHSLDEWRSLIIQGKVRVNGMSVAPDHVLKKNDGLSYSVILREPQVDRNIKIVHQEDAFLVACKPGNLPSHADGNFIKNTFIYIIRAVLAEGGWNGPVKLVHRLDRETSGLILVAKSDEAHRFLAGQFENSTVEKEYTAVAKGATKALNFEVEGAIGTDYESNISIRKKVVPLSTPRARAALTRFETIERLSSYTLLRCIPETGRTNQIRVHLAHIGHPLAGDKLYGRSDGQFLEFVRGARSGNYEPLPWMEAPRHMLHASKLVFTHPDSKTRVQFECPVPEDMQAFIEQNKNHH
jgi:23S rRNA pseudouridine1911/1915/1917 synthase